MSDENAVQIALMNELRAAANLHMQASVAERETHQKLLAAAQMLGDHQAANGEEGDRVLIGYINPSDARLGIFPTKDEVYTTPVFISVAIEEEP